MLGTKWDIRAIAYHLVPSNRSGRRIQSFSLAYSNRKGSVHLHSLLLGTKQYRIAKYPATGRHTYTEISNGEVLCCVKMQGLLWRCWVCCGDERGVGGNTILF